MAFSFLHGTFHQIVAHTFDLWPYRYINRRATDIFGHDFVLRIMSRAGIKAHPNIFFVSFICMSYMYCIEKAFDRPVYHITCKQRNTKKGFVGKNHLVLRLNR